MRFQVPLSVPKPKLSLSQMSKTSKTLVSVQQLEAVSCFFFLLCIAVVWFYLRYRRREARESRAGAAGGVRQIRASKIAGAYNSNSTETLCYTKYAHDSSWLCISWLFAGEGYYYACRCAQEHGASTQHDPIHGTCRLFNKNIINGEWSFSLLTVGGAADVLRQIAQNASRSGAKVAWMIAYNALLFS